MYAIFFWQLVNKTADYFNSIIFILYAKISSKISLRKIGKQLNWLVFNRNAQKLLRLVETAFDSKVVSLRRMRKQHLI